MGNLDQMRSFKLRLGIVALSLCCAQAASAQSSMTCLLGGSATMDTRFPNLGNVISVHPASPTVVSGAIEFPPYVFPNGSSFPWQVDVADMSLNIQHLGSGNNLGGAAFNGSSTLTPFQVTFNASQIFVNYQGLGTIGPGVTNLDVHCVPEPSAAGLALLALTPFVARRRRTFGKANA
jgi:hypothetical protein